MRREPPGFSMHGHLNDGARAFCCGIIPGCDMGVRLEGRFTAANCYPVVYSGRWQAYGCHQDFSSRYREISDVPWLTTQTV